ncbi:hypothetical protein HN358_03730 [Candidatus Uhrbacteria bacterium]|jgi:hypothetical protein|nr:hypothetical protein [Candidatus Uhrbacteria bacterium]MBT7717670.1 hypothetical protein [Candidatus Uhrbacteria bacterium]
MSVDDQIREMGMEQLIAVAAAEHGSPWGPYARSAFWRIVSLIETEEEMLDVWRRVKAIYPTEKEYWAKSSLGHGGIDIIQRSFPGLLITSPKSKSFIPRGGRAAKYHKALYRESTDQGDPKDLLELLEGNEPPYQLDDDGDYR